MLLLVAAVFNNDGRSRRTFCRLLTFVCGVVPLVESQLCDVDEFYDPVVENCALCQDVCDELLMPQSMNYCKSVCPDYYDKTHSQQPQQLMRQPPFQEVVGSQTPKQQEVASSQASLQHATMTSSVTAWTDNPLYWIIIASSAVAFVALVAIVALLICIRRQRQRDALEEDGHSSGTGKKPIDSCSRSPGEYIAVSTCSSTSSSTPTELEELPSSAPASYYVTDDCSDTKKPTMTSALRLDLAKPVSSRNGAEG